METLETLETQNLTLRKIHSKENIENWAWESSLLTLQSLLAMTFIPSSTGGPCLINQRNAHEIVLRRSKSGDSGDSKSNLEKYAFPPDFKNFCLESVLETLLSLPITITKIGHRHLTGRPRQRHRLPRVLVRVRKP
jgi:hypothetical protein